MALTYARAYEQIDDTLAGQLPSEVSALEIVEEAGRHLVAMHDWRWCVAGEAFVATRRQTIPGLTGAFWNRSTKSVTQTNAPFGDYTWVPGDTIKITGGTGATVGTYEIVAKTNNNSIQLLSRNLSASDVLLTGDITSADLTFTTLALPQDLRRIRSLTTVNNLVNRVELVTFDYIQQLRSSEIEIDGATRFFVAPRWAGLGPSGFQVPVLEVYPWEDTSGANLFRMVYDRVWPTGFEDHDRVPIPLHMEPLFKALVRAVARGYAEEDEASISMRLAEIAAGPVFALAKRQDNSIQRSYGAMRNTAAFMASVHSDYWLTTPVEGPQ